MARMRRRNYSRREQPKTQWFAHRLSSQITVDTANTVVHKYLGRQLFTEEVEHEAVIERWRGTLFAVTASTTIVQLSVAAHIVEEAYGDTIDANASDFEAKLDLFDQEAGSDFPVFHTFACVDNATTNRWNGREIDSKARRKIRQGSQVIWSASCYPLVVGVSKNVTVGINYRNLVKFN